MSEHYEPDSRFVERLEWQLSSEFRRASRLRPSARRVTVPRGIVAVSLLVGSLLTGVAAMKAADYIKDSRQKKLEIARAETDVRLKEAYLGFTRERGERARTQYSGGLIQEEEYLEAKRTEDIALYHLKRSVLNLDEVRMSGEAPRDELSAPLVGGRDFVSERLAIEQKEMLMGCELLERRLERLEPLVKKGMIEGAEWEQIRAEIAARKVMIDKIKERLDLRSRFVSGEITAREVEILDRKALVERNLRLAQSQVDSLREQLKRLQMLEAEGVVSPSESRELQLALTGAEAELQLAALELEVLEEIQR